MAQWDEIQRNRAITLVVAIATLMSNVLSSVLVSQLPDDPFHLARNLGWYLHFANILSVFGFIGAVREHALSVAMFSIYLMLDTIICSVPNFLVLDLLRTFSSDLCSPSSSLFSTQASYQSTAAPSGPAIISSRSSYTPDLPYPTGQWDSFSSNWSQDGCLRIVTLAQWTLTAGVVAGTLLQFVGALYVRKYAKGLWVREVFEEESFARSVERRLILEERGLPGIDEDELYAGGKP